MYLYNKHKVLFNVSRDKWLHLYNCYKGIAMERVNEKWSNYEIEIKPELKSKVFEFMGSTE